MKKRMLCWVLALAMVFSLCPAMGLPVAAATVTEHQQVSNNDVLTLTEGDTYTVTTKNGGAAVEVKNGGTLNVKDVIFAGCSVTGSSKDGGAILNAGTVNYSGTVVFDGNTATGNGGALCDNGGNNNLRGIIKLMTATDTIYNKGVLNWDISAAKTGFSVRLDGFDKLTNHNQNSLNITVADGQQNGFYVIATGDMSCISSDNKNNVFKLTGVSGAKDAKVTVNGDAVTYNGIAYTLQTVGDKYLVLQAGPVCKIVETSITYRSLQKGIDAAEEGQTVQLLVDIYENVTVDGADTLSIDLAGRVLTSLLGGSIVTNNGSLTLTESDKTARHILVAADGSWVWNDDYNTTGKESGTDYLTVVGGMITGGTGTLMKPTALSAEYPCGGGVLNNKSLTLAGGNIAGNTAVYGGGVYLAPGAQMSVTGGKVTGNLAKDASGTVNSCGGGVYISQTGSLTLDGSAARVDDNTAVYGGGVWTDGKLELLQGSLSTNCASGAENCCGGGAFVAANGVLTMGAAEKSPTVTGNTAVTSGAGVFLFGKMTMETGYIRANNAEKSGGGVYVYYSGTAGSEVNGVFTMNGGNIASNSAGDKGGGVYVDDHADVLLAGNVIGNTAGVLGGGVCANSGVTLGGKVNVLSNKVGYNLSNLFLRADGSRKALVTVSAAKPLDTAAKVYVTLGDKDNNATVGAFTTNGTAADMTHFTSDVAIYKVNFNNNKTAATLTDDYLELVKYPLNPLGTATGNVNLAASNITAELAKQIIEDQITPAANDCYIFAATATDLTFQYIQYDGSSWLTEATDTLANIIAKDGNAFVIGGNVKKPTGINADSTGTSQKLVSAGSADLGTMYYAPGTGATTAPTTGWSTDLPTGTNAATYYIWYKSIATPNYLDSTPQCVTGTIKHVHSWSYTAQGAVITATCSDSDTGHGTPKTATLTVVAPTLTYYGEADKSALATLTGGIEGVTNPDIIYFSGKIKLDSAPTAAGSYTAKITLGSATASVDYTIAQAGQDAPTGITATDETIKGKADGKLNSLTTAMEYRKATDTQYTAVTAATLTDLEAGDYKVRYAAKTNYAASEDVTLTVNPGKALTVTFDSVGGSNVTGQTQLSWHDKATKPADPTREHSAFVEWRLDGEAYDFDTQLEQAITLEAYWILDETTSEETTIQDDGQTTTKIQVVGDDDIQAAGLESVARAVKADDNQENDVKVVLSAAATTETPENTAGVTAIEAETGDGKTVELLDISLTKFIGDTAGQPITDTGEDVIEILIPFDPTGKQNIQVYRYHGEQVQPFTYATTGADGTYYILNKVLHLFSSQFSLYGVTYKEVEGECSYCAPFAEGSSLTLSFAKQQDTPAGYTVQKTKCGYTVYDENAGQYLAIQDGAFALTDEAFTWQYDGGLYAHETKTTQTGRHYSWFWPWGGRSCTATTKVKLYLNYTADGFALSEQKVCVYLRTLADCHTVLYQEITADTHTAICVNCGDRVTEPHTYDPQTGLCDCGAVKPGAGCVTDVTVGEKRTTGWSWFGWGRKGSSTSYQYTLTPVTKLVTWQSISYSLDGKNWCNGRVFTHRGKLDTFQIKVVDSNGVESYWVYRDGDVYPEG